VTFGDSLWQIVIYDSCMLLVWHAACSTVLYVFCQSKHILFWWTYSRNNGLPFLIWGWREAKGVAVSNCNHFKYLKTFYWLLSPLIIQFPLEFQSARDNPPSAVHTMCTYKAGTHGYTYQRARVWGPGPKQQTSKFDAEGNFDWDVGMGAHIII